MKLAAMILVAFACSLSAPSFAISQPKKPNVVVIITDDQGYGDIAAHGNELYDIVEDPGQKQDVFNDYPAVVRNLKQDFDAYWQRVTPEDRARVKHIVGHPHDPETYLHSSDWYLPNTPWNHATVSQGVQQSGTWWITAAEQGTFQFELRRWPKEVDAPVSGVPSIDKAIDAWDPTGGKAYLAYAGERPPFKALPVRFVKLTVGDFVAVKKVGEMDTKIVFEVPLEKKDYKVQAEMLDADRRLVAGAYYVYVNFRRRKIADPGGRRIGGSAR